jgi:hypothetical protein
MNTEDLWVFKKIGEIGTKITGYRCVSTFHDFKYHPKEVTTGAFDDWMYDHHGIFTYTIELWDLPSEAGIKDRKWIEWWREHPHEEDHQILKWIDEHGASDAYMPWQPFEHPQLGKIELGGWNNLFTWRNPPLGFAEAEVKKHYPFILSLAELLPHLSIHTLNIDRMDSDKFILTVVENSGFLPSFTSQQSKTRKSCRPVRVELELPEGAVLTTGKLRQELGHLEGRSNKMDLGANYTDSPTDNRARLEWVIQAVSGTKIRLKTSERADRSVEDFCNNLTMMREHHEQTLVQEKVHQAIGILREMNTDMWLTFVRETTSGGDPILPLIYGLDLTWQSALILTQSGDRIAIVGRLEAEAALRTGAYDTILHYDQSIQPELLGVLERLNPDEIAVNYSVDDVHADGLSYGMYQLLCRYLEGTPYLSRLVSAEKLHAALRGRKTPHEVELIRAAIHTTNLIIKRTVDFLEIGMTEIEVSNFMHAQLDELYVNPAWELINCPTVNAGPESPIGHIGPTELKISPGHIVH